MKKKRLAIILIIVLILGTTTGVGLYVLFHARKQTPPSESVSSAGDSTPETVTTIPPNETTIEPPQPIATSWPVVWSNQQSAAIDVVVNKKHQLPSTYVPAGLKNPNLAGNGGNLVRSEAQLPLQGLFEAAKTAGHDLFVISSYRSYANQQSTYNGYVKQYGQVQADTFSARPGFSEHQTGLAADIGLTSGECSLDECFGTTSAGKWLAEHAADFGFIIRYQQGKDDITGYHYEPWHIRYLGTELAKKVYQSGKTYEEYTRTEGGDYQ